MSNKSNNKVRLELHATKLKNVHGAFSTSNPYAVVTLLASDPREKPKILGQTEVIKHTLAPHWTKSFDIDFELGKMIRVNVALFDEIKKGDNKPMGSAMFEIGNVLAARGNTKAKRLRSGGTLFARVTSAQTQSAGKFHVTLRGVGLKNVEGLFGKSDPFFEFCTKANAAGSVTWQPVFRSKHVNNDLNPKWEPCSIDLDRVGGDLNQPVLIRIYDWEKNGKHQNLGSVETTIQGLLDALTTGGGAADVKSIDTSKGLSINARGKEHGKLIVTMAKVEGMAGGTAAADHVASTTTRMADMNVNDSVSVTPTMEAAAATVAAATKATKAFGFSTNEPYVPTSASAPPAPYVPGGVSETPASLTSSTKSEPYVPASASAPPAPFVPSASAPSVPYVPTPIPPTNESVYTATPLPPPLAPPPPRPTFVDYIAGGCELELAIGIDFTGSNGDPRKPGTLHYIHRDGQLNDYEKALTAVGSVVARYDSDQTFPVYGFGAKFNGQIQHCFQVGNAPTLAGMAGVLEGYRSVFRTGLTMSGPTVFSEVIDMVAAIARSRQEEAQKIGKQSYVILLILTDGAVSDIEATKRSLHAASDAPLSVVIVGIGNADFSAMQFLDDFQAGSSNGGRDICQFVNFNEHRNDRAALTRETLDEIPDQLVEYFHSRGIKPLPPVSTSQLSLAVSEVDDEDIDLNMNISPDGEISLADHTGAVYDDSKYDTMQTYVPTPAPKAAPAPFIPNYGGASAPAPYQPEQPSAPYVPSQQPYQPRASAPPPQPYQARASAPPPQPYQPRASAPPPQPYQPHAAAPNSPHSSQQRAPPVVASQPRLFHVQVPPGVYPGQQLQVQNPVTHQNMIVVVPQGVGPGGKFAVQY